MLKILSLIALNLFLKALSGLGSDSEPTLLSYSLLFFSIMYGMKNKLILTKMNKKESIHNQRESLSPR